MLMSALLVTALVGLVDPSASSPASPPAATKTVPAEIVELAKSCKRDSLGRIWCHRYADQLIEKETRKSLGERDPLKSDDAPLWFTLEKSPSVSISEASIRKGIAIARTQQAMPKDAQGLGANLLMSASVKGRDAFGVVLERLPSHFHVEDNDNFRVPILVVDLPDSLVEGGLLRQPIEIRKVSDALFSTTAYSTAKGSFYDRGITLYARDLSTWRFHRKFDFADRPESSEVLLPVSAEELQSHLDAGGAPGIPQWRSRWTGKSWKWDLSWKPLSKPPASAPQPAPASGR